MTVEIQPGFIALHGNRTESLAEAVFAWLRQCPLAPLEEEIILVQSNGMAEWLKMMLAREGGVCAATRVELPARFMWRAYRQVPGKSEVPAHSPLDKTALMWRLMRLLPELLLEPGFEPVAGFLLPGEPGRLLQLAGRLADLFDQYQVYRADWLNSWAGGRDVLTAPGRADQPVPPDQTWQPKLWRALLAELDEAQRSCIRPLLHERVLGALQSGAPLASPVARRVVLFGMTHLPLPTLQTVAALARHSQVMLAIPNPCRFHWADIMDGRELHRMSGRRHPLRAGIDLAALPLDAMHANAHPLLAAWGRQGRDFVRQLDEFDDTQQARQNLALPRIDLFDEDDQLDAPLLIQVQNRIRDLVPLAEHPPVVCDPKDRSIVFHVAHSMLREVEILHDQLLHLFAQAPADRPVHPRDVVVMVPAIDTVAPAIRAVFGQYGRHDARFIPFDIADLGTRHSSPLVAAMEWLLRLPQQRCRLSELRDLLDVPAVAARFGLDADALPRLMQWMAGAGVCWGLNEDHRADLGLHACGEQNTGWFGLRRMLLGYAAGTGPLAGATQSDNAASFAGIEPYAEIGGLEAELAGGLARLLDRLVYWCGVTNAPATPAEWAGRCRLLTADMVKAVDDTDRQTLSALDDALTVWQEACEQAGFESEVPLPVAREAWLGTLEEPALNNRFRAGGVTFCTLMPMRAIPFEVVCLLGMNDGDYPRRSQRSDFDLMGLPGLTRPGDRARRDDDRQLMLEAVLSARRVLYLSWTGRNVRDNSEQPPSVLVSQLRDYLAAGWKGNVLAQRTTQHPLQPFSRHYFEPDTELFTYAREWRAAHLPEESAGAALAVPPMAAFEPDPRIPLTVAQLAAFLRNPVKLFFRQRLNVVFEDAEEDGADNEAFALAGLEEYALISELLRNVGADLSDSGNPGESGALVEQQVSGRLQRVRRAGRLPLGGLGERAERLLNAELVPMLKAWQEAQAESPTVEIRRRLHFTHGSVTLEDWLEQLHGDGSEGKPVWLALDPGRLCTDAKKGLVRTHRMVLPWVRSLVAAVSQVPVQGVLVGRDATLRIRPMAAETARTSLTMLVDIWREGLSGPLPLALRTALAHVDGKRPADTYDGSYQQQGESEEPCLGRAYPDFETLSEDGRFEAMAEMVYGPLAAWVTEHVSATAHPDTVHADESAAP